MIEFAMQIKKITVELGVKSIPKSVDFYVNTLGFQVADKAGLPDVVWVALRYGEIELMLMEKKSLSEDVGTKTGGGVGSGVVLFVEVEGIEKFISDNKSKLDIVKGLHETSYGTKEASIADVDGFVLVLAEKIWL